jgi:hypothetical protein
MKKRLNSFALLFCFLFFSSTILAQSTLTFDDQPFGTQAWTENSINWTSGTWANIRTDYLGVSDGDYIQADHNLDITTLFILIDDMEDYNSYVDLTGYDSDDNIIQTQRYNSPEFMFDYEQINLTGFTNIYKLKFEFDDLSGFGMVVVRIDDIGYADLGILPVELISFAATISGTGVLLNWSTATEVNNYGFEIQRNNPPPSPLPGREENGWVTIGFIDGHGNSNSPKQYSFSDESVTKGNYSYRLKQIDLDGKFEYSGVVEVEIDTSPKEFSLAQNYPNPFNPTTTIKYQIPNAGNVSLKIYDVLGAEVMTLVNTTQAKGRYEVNFDASQLASDVYIYRIQANDYVASRKMMLLK